jgi:hypothetical protein
MEAAVGDACGDRNDEIERPTYGFSLVVCRHDAVSHEGSVATGTVTPPSRLEDYARSAGFTAISVLPIEGDLWRFYSLDQ